MKTTDITLENTELMLEDLDNNLLQVTPNVALDTMSEADMPIFMSIGDNAFGLSIMQAEEVISTLQLLIQLSKKQEKTIINEEQPQEANNHELNLKEGEYINKERTELVLYDIEGKDDNTVENSSMKWVLEVLPNVPLKELKDMEKPVCILTDDNAVALTRGQTQALITVLKELLHHAE